MRVANLDFSRQKNGTKYFASSNPHPPHSRAYGRYNKFLRILETSTPNSRRPFWTLSKTRLASCSGGAGRILGRIHRQGILSGTRDPLAGCSDGSTGELLWRDTRRDPLASYSGILSGILGGTHWPAALVGYSEGSSGEPLWRDTRRDPLASRFGGIGILGGSTG